MRSVLLMLIGLAILSCEKTKYEKTKTNNIVSYDDYINDLNATRALSKNLSCDSILNLLKEIKTLDGKEKVAKLYGDKCDLVSNTAFKGNTHLSKKLNDILSKDQYVREEFNSIMDSLDLNSSSGKDVSKLLSERKYFWDSIVKKTDSINALEFSQVIDSTGEWIGAEYYKRSPETPRIGILVGHLPEKDYTKYTKMAYESATQNKEYWSRVRSLVNFSKKYPIEDIEYFYKRKKIVPFRFIDYNTNDDINESSGLTKLEFTSIAESSFSEGIKPLSYQLSSSAENAGNRKKLLEQAKQILTNYGWEEDLIKINFDEEMHKDYRLYYQIVQ